MRVGNRREGFAGDGDYVEIPIAETGNIEYFNSADSSQWTKSPTDLHANADSWVGFTFDGSLLYCMAVDIGTSPNTFYLASINSGGTLVSIGNAQITFAVTTGFHYHVNAGTAGATCIQRNVVGSGNILILMNEGVSGGEVCEINIANGTVVSGPTVVAADLVWPCYKSADGIYLNGEGSQNFFQIHHADTGTALPNWTTTHTSEVNNYGSIGGAQILRPPMVWKDELYFQLEHNAGNVDQPRIHDKDNVDAFLKSMLQAFFGSNAG